MNTTTVAAAALTAVLGALPLDAKTNVWYVSSDPAKGSESNDGKTPETPFLKIDTACRNLLFRDNRNVADGSIVDIGCSEYYPAVGLMLPLR